MQGLSPRNAVCGLLLLWVALPVGAREFEQRVPAESGGRLRVNLDVGSVEIEGHDEDEVRVEASASGVGGVMEFQLRGRGSDVELRGDRKGVLGWLSPSRVRVRIRVPEEFSIDVRTGGGEVEIEALEGSVSARTRGGQISVSEIEGPVELRTSGGRIRAERIEGDVTARTSGGTVVISEVEGRVDAETSGGGMQIHDVTGPVRVRTSGGSISVRFTEAPAGDIRTSGGGIEVEFPEGEGLRLDAETSGGAVEIDLPITLVGRVERSRARGDVNGGGELVRVRTSGGPIRIRER